MHCLRILPSCHSSPVPVIVADDQICASRRSAIWCPSSVDRLWETKAPFIRESERIEAAAAFEHARVTYDSIIKESRDD